MTKALARPTVEPDYIDTVGVDVEDRPNLAWKFWGASISAVLGSVLFLAYMIYLGMSKEAPPEPPSIQIPIEPYSSNTTQEEMDRRLGNPPRDYPRTPGAVYTDMFTGESRDEKGNPVTLGGPPIRRN